ncbi:cytotoxic translational repressor of toxin-antitoxin stability system [Rhizobium sp. TRM95111]|uniref:type II toxin-antitoxin system RelE family toxin n=1 Tax=Rhizobium alarense TaxID=2846851 RepID=UPI001F17C76F|nr:cytotoxic translational repressor of toxin-antitoxin stability system [Rhizobium alarense]MCF3638505.1 cytotoxic translational repressor of toxin-antitoxin stability system [Rhizobium alarense]
MKRVEYSKIARAVLDRMQPKRRAAIRSKVDAFARGDVVDVKKLSGSKLLRICVGDDRVLIDEEAALVLVVKVGPRGSIYKE